MRFREISGALSRFYLDVLLGSRAFQAHCAEPTLWAAQAGQLGQWADAGLRQQVCWCAGAVQLALTLALVIGLVYRQTAMAQNPADLVTRKLTGWQWPVSASGVVRRAENSR